MEIFPLERSQKCGQLLEVKNMFQSVYFRNQRRRDLRSTSSFSDQSILDPVMLISIEILEVEKIPTLGCFFFTGSAPRRRRRRCRSRHGSGRVGLLPAGRPARPPLARRVARLGGRLRARPPRLLVPRKVFRYSLFIGFQMFFFPMLQSGRFQVELSVEFCKNGIVLNDDSSIQ